MKNFLGSLETAMLKMRCSCIKKKLMIFLLIVGYAVGINSFAEAANVENLRHNRSDHIKALSKKKKDRAVASLKKRKLPEEARERAAALGLGPENELKKLRERSDKKGKLHTRYKQHYRGVPVWGSDVVIHSKDGEPTGINGETVKDLEYDLADVKPGMDAKKALPLLKEMHKKRRELNKELVYENEMVELTIYVDEEGKGRLVYYVSFFVDSVDGGNPSRPYFIIDADTGEILKEWEGLTNQKVGTGPGGNIKTGQYEYGTDYDFLDVEVSTDQQDCVMQTPNVRTVDLNHASTPYDSTPFKYSCYRNTRKEINGAYSPLNDAHYFGGVVYDLYQDWYNMAPLTFQLQLKVHYSVNHENAYWNGSYMYFGDGASTFYPLTSLDIVSHEVSHGVTEQNSNLVYIGQSGGINEAFSDMAGEAAEFFMRGSNDFETGADVFKAEGEALRYLYDPPKDGASIGHADDYYPGIDVHYSSGVFNKAFYLLATTPGWGIRKAFDVFVKANIDYWTPNTDFIDGADGVYRAALDLGYPFMDVVNVFSQVGVDVELIAIPAGMIFLDREVYGLDTAIAVTVLDADLNTDPALIEQYNDLVTITTTGGDQESVITITEIGPDSGIFTGSISSADASVIQDDDVLQVTCGIVDIITATYTDADDGTGNPATPMDTAGTDCDPPVISNVVSSDVIQSSTVATAITWDTDQLADSRVYLGTDLPLDLQTAASAFNASYVTTHTITLSGLVPETTYYFAVESIDETGNVTVNESGIEYYQFTTPPAATYYVPDDYATIQAAINATPSYLGNEIIVRAGTYYERINFKGKVLIVRSEDGPEATIINGSGSGSVVTFTSYEDPDSILAGFTLENGAAANGGGIVLSGSSPTITNCIISDNSASGVGGGVYCSSNSAPAITNCTISGNSAGNAGGGICSSNSSPVVVNTILWGDTADGTPDAIFETGTGTIDITYSDIEGGWAGTGNIDCDPGFLGFSSRKYYLTNSSCVIDMGTATGAPDTDIEGQPRPLGSGYDMGADEHDVHNGVVLLDKTAYPLNAILTVLVQDNDLNINPSGVEQYTDRITITTLGGDHEGTVTITETGPDTGIFSGSIASEDAAAVQNDNTVQGACGTDATITAVYADSDNGTGSSAAPSATAAMDCEPAVISGISSNITAIYATITWNTDQPATSRVYYGTTTPQSLNDLDMEVNNSSLVTAHTINLSGLTQNTTYYFAVESTDNNGNITIDDNGGQYYQFTTPSSTTYYVPNNFPTIQAAIDGVASNWGHEIIVRAGTYHENINFRGKGLTLRSENGPGVTIIDGSASGSVVTFSASEGRDSILDGFTITNGLARSGAGIYCSNSSPTITNCIISNNSNGSGGMDFSYGGGVYCSNSSPVISNCTISGNSMYRGGGMALLNNSSPEITGTTISGNSATRGGGMYIVSSSPTITNSTISNNSAEVYTGGGIHMEDSSPAITNCNISGNVSNDYGGGMYCNYFSSPTITDSVINNNSSHEGGGIKCENYSSPTITGCTINGNSGRYGGGIRCAYSSSPTIINSTISGNYDGGGISCYDSSPTITNCVINNNVGSGIVSNSPLVISDSTFKGNEGSSGGGIYLLPSASSEITNCTITGNSATNGGGMFFSSTQAKITNCIITDNSATNGGGIYSNYAPPVITNCTISNNSAVTSGGGIYTYGSSPMPKLVNTILWGDTAGGNPNEIYQRIATDLIDITYSDIQGGWTGTGNIDCDPGFLGFPSREFYLTHSSCVIDMGTDIGAPADDIDGQPRPLGSGFDMGADEHDGHIGAIALDKELYPRDATVGVLVTDSDLNTNPGVIEQYSDLVTITTTGGDLENAITITETGPDTGIFTGSITTEDAGVTQNDGMLQVICGLDTITAIYADGDDGSGNPASPSDTAATDCDSPVITNAVSSDIIQDFALISWDTDELSNSRVYYGTTPPQNIGDLDQETYNPFISTAHTVELTGLIPDTTYFFAVESTDMNGNTTIDDNGGQYYQFSTLQIAIYYVPDDYPTIQLAIDDIPSYFENEIIVRAGTYLENINFKGKGIHLRSEDGPETTIINGKGAASVVTFSYYEGPDSVLDGFTLTNGSASNGGGINSYLSAPTITNCIIKNNSASSAGGGVYFLSSASFSPVITNSVISDNSSGGQGGGIYAYANTFSPVISNCTISNNSASGNGGGIYAQGYNGRPMTTVVNTILWGDTAGGNPNEVYESRSGSIDISYSDIAGGWAGTGNIDADPLFVDNFHLANISPCIDAGTGDTATYPSLPSDDIDGESRPQNDGYEMGCDERLVDLTPPSSAITDPTEGAVIPAGTIYTISGTAVDTGGSGLDYVEISTDNGATWNQASDTLSWTYSWNVSGSGNHTLLSRATDIDGNVETPGNGVTVLVNSAPVINGEPAVSVDEDVAYSFMPAVSDADGDTVTLSIVNKPAWADFDPATGALTGTPTNDDVGSTTGIVITASDAVTSSSIGPFDLTVVNVNDAPTFTSAGIITYEGQVGTPMGISVTDVDVGDTHTFEIVTQPTTGVATVVDNVLTYTTADVYAGHATFTYRAIDTGGLSIEGTCYVYIYSVNDAPVISGYPATGADVDSLYNFLPTASDEEGASLTFSVQNLPAWAQFDTATGSLTGTPTADDLGVYPGIVISVSDGSVTTSLPPFNITVYEVVTEWAMAGAGSPYMYNDVALDSQGNFIVAGMTGVEKFDPAGNLIWSVEDHGNDSVAVDSEDNIYTVGGSKTKKFDSDGNLLWVEEYATGVYHYGKGVAVDADGNIYTAGYINASPDTNAILIKYDTDGNLIWAEEYDGGLTDAANDITLDNEGNPYFTGYSFLDETTYTYQILTVKYDADGNLIWASRDTVATATGPMGNGIGVDPDGNVYIAAQEYNLSHGHPWMLKYNADGELRWSKEYLDSMGYGPLQDILFDADANMYVTGRYNLEVMTAMLDRDGNVQWVQHYDADGGNTYSNSLAMDGCGNIYLIGRGFIDALWQNLYVKMAMVTEPPVAEEVDWFVNEDTTGYGSLTALGSDCFATSFSIVDGPTLGTLTLIDPESGQFSYTPFANITGYDTFTFVADNGLVSEPATVGITIEPVNDPPVISGTPDEFVKKGTAYSFTPSAWDIEGNTLTFSIVNKPQWANFDSFTGTLSGTPDYGDTVITNGIVISVSDGQDSASLAPFTLAVDTITITRARYTQADRELSIRAETDYGAGAVLTVAGYGPMGWRSSRNRWELRVGDMNLTDVPSEITVTGPEGSATLAVEIR